MNRRTFLQSSTVAAAAAPLAAGQTAPASKRILITCGSHSLAQTLAAGLKETHAIRLTDRLPVRTEHEFVSCALGHDPQTNVAVRGVDAVVHVAEPLPDETHEQQIDFLTRCTYNLLWAAAEENVPRVVFLSTLDVMSGYDPRFTVSESWRPRPSAEPRVLAKHLGEYTSREFAREGKGSIVALRLGKVVRAENVKGQPIDPLWVDERDVVHAVSRALEARIGKWQVFHIQMDSPRARFAIRRAQKALGYEPKVQF